MKQSQSNTSIVAAITLTAASFSPNTVEAQYPTQDNYPRHAAPHYVNSYGHSESNWARELQMPSNEQNTFDSYGPLHYQNQDFQQATISSPQSASTAQNQSDRDNSVSTAELFTSLGTVMKAADQFLAKCNHWALLVAGGALVLGAQTLIGRAGQEMHKNFSPYGRSRQARID